MNNSSLLIHAKRLRKDMTLAERSLWFNLRGNRLGVKFKRQVPIGSYIVDFICMERRLIIEVDGGQHQVNQDYDKMRTAYLNSIGFKVLRFWNNQVLQELRVVMTCIHHHLKQA